SRFRTTAATATLPSKSSMPASACTRRAISSKVAASTWALICGAPPAGIEACGSPPRSQLIKVSHHSGTFRNHSHTVLTWPLIHGAATSLIQVRKPSTTPTVHVQAVDTAPSIHGAATSLTHVKKASTLPTTQFQDLPEPHQYPPHLPVNPPTRYILNPGQKTFDYSYCPRPGSRYSALNPRSGNISDPRQKGVDLADNPIPNRLGNSVDPRPCCVA